MIPFADVFCDSLSVTFPPLPDGAAPAVVPDIFALIAPLCPVSRFDGKTWDVGAYGGTVRAGMLYRVYQMGFSGGALRSIREAGLVRELALMLHGADGYRVTSLHATCDYALDAPEWLSKLYYRIRRGSLVLGQKVVSFRDVERHSSVNAEGRTVNNLYLGKSSGDIRVLVYDKRHERLVKGFPDIGNMLRIEVRLKSQVKCSALDALSPERLYYHYAAPALVSLPESVRPWEAHGQGFEMPQLQSHFTTYQRLKMLVEESASIKQALRLITKPDSGGMVAFMHLLEHRMAADALPSLSDALPVL